MTLSLSARLPALVSRARNSRDMLVLTAVTFGVQLLSVVSSPLVARLLGPVRRGEMASVWVLAGISAQVMTGGLAIAITQIVASRRAPAREVLAGRLPQLFGVALLPAIASGLLAPVVVNDPSNRVGISVGSFVIALLTIAQAIVAAMLRGEGDARRVSAISLVSYVVYVGGVVGLFVGFDHVGTTTVLSTYAGAQLVGLVAGWVLLRRGPAASSPVTVRSLWTAFRDNFVSGLSLLTLGADIFVVSLVVDKREVGLYAVAVSMTNLAAMLLTAIAAMLLPRMAARAKHEAVLLMRRWLGGALVVGTVFALALEAVMAPAVRILLGRQFVEAIPCARVLIVTWTVVGMYRMFAAATQAQGHPRRASAAEFLSLVFMVVVGAYTANRWGIVAMAWTVCAAGAFGAAVLAVRLAWQSEQSAGARSAVP